MSTSYNKFLLTTGDNFLFPFKKLIMKISMLAILATICLLFGISNTKMITINGHVNDENGNAVAAKIQAGKIKAMADANGNYSIAADEKEKYLK